MSPNLSDSPGDRMNIHNNARLTPKGREDMVRAVVDHGLSKAAAACQFNTTSKTVAKWIARFKAEGIVGLRDRSSKSLSMPSQIRLATADAVERLRRERRTGALLDRLTHHVHILEMSGDSYRLAHSKRRSRRSRADATPDAASSG